MSNEESLVDLHNHAERSKNTTATIRDYVAAALNSQIAVGITEHNRLCPCEGVVDGVLLLPGMEVLNDFGDFLVFGASAACIQHRDIFALIDAVHSERGVIIAAHPYAGYGVFRAVESRLAHEIVSRLDAVEVLNGLVSVEANRQAEALAQEHRKPQTGGSDAHHTNQLFKAGTRFTRNITCVADLLSAIKAGECEPTEFMPYSL